MPQPRIYTDAAARQRAFRKRQAQARSEERAAKGLPPAPPITTMPSRARWAGLQEHARVALQTARDEMQAYQDERTEAWRDSERGQAFADQLADLEQIIEDLQALAERP